MIQEFEAGDADEIRTQRALAKEQLGVEIPLRSAAAYASPKNPWPREKETEKKQVTLHLPCRKERYTGSGKGKETQYGGSSSAASPSASAEEGGKRHTS